MTKEVINYLYISPVKCDCCGQMVNTFSSKDGGAWFGEYLKPEEEKVCRNCIKDRPGYKEEFLEKIGVPVEALDDN